MIKNEVVIGNCRLLLADCMDVMADLDNKEFELAIVDPPYRDENQPTKDMRNNGSMKNFGMKPDPEYFNQLFRLTKNQIIWGANNFSLPNYKGFVIWKKLTISEAFTMSMCELAYISEGLGTVSKWIELPPQDKYRIHPTQKPVPLYEWLLTKYAKPGQRILDTHGGSMSSVIAAIKCGNPMVCIEKDEESFDMAVKRIEDFMKQATLFEFDIEPVKVPVFEQASLL